METEAGTLNQPYFHNPTLLGDHEGENDYSDDDDGDDHLYKNTLIASQSLQNINNAPPAFSTSSIGNIHSFELEPGNDEEIESDENDEDELRKIDHFGTRQDILPYDEASNIYQEGNDELADEQNNIGEEGDLYVGRVESTNNAYKLINTLRTVLFILDYFMIQPWLKMRYSLIEGRFVSCLFFIVSLLGIYNICKEPILKKSGALSVCIGMSQLFYFMSRDALCSISLNNFNDFGIHAVISILLPGCMGQIVWKYRSQIFDQLH